MKGCEARLLASRTDVTPMRDANLKLNVPMPGRKRSDTASRRGFGRLPKHELTVHRKVPKQAHRQ